MSRFLKEIYKGLEVYTPGEQPKDAQYIKLNTNESPYPPSEGVIRAVNSEEVSKLRLYSDPECIELRKAVARLYQVGTENVYLANGSDDILNFAFMAFTGNGGAIFPEISYGFYSVFGKLHNVDCKTVALGDDFSINPKDYYNSGRMVVIANPNAPTGLALTVDEVEGIVKSNPNNVVVIDEAYVDFGGESCIRLIDKYDNLLVVQTFSKSRSMAGARLGFAFASKEIIEDLKRIKYSTNPYNINRLTLVAGRVAIEEDEYYKENCKKIIKTREWTKGALEELGFDVVPGCANFLFAKCDKISGKELYLRLKEKGVLVRHFDKEKICEYNRITIGTEQEMEIMIAKVKEILEGLG